ncbi:calcium-binding protein [Dankookia rubra]|uniref:Calcium-binding protein n=1 Tax=Dankookia rubra TaxID=1442381 RepID=A0A4R5QDS1_9PROT|nr:calcium-binding protein [Dankookia rubra]TDH61106.1 calcium-binding protein [Dankookia rubra]
MAYRLGTINRDILLGTTGNDVLIGLDGDDRLDGGLGNDILIGGAGADIFVFRPGEGMDAIADAGAGDLLVVQGGPIYDLDWITRDGQDLVIHFSDNGGYLLDPLNSVRVLNHFAGSPLTKVQVDTAFNLATYGIDAAIVTFTIAGGVTGSNQGDNPEVILGTAGDDDVHTNGGLWDMVVAGAGDDLVTVDAGTLHSLIRPGDGNDTVLGGDGADTVRGSQGSDSLDGGAGFDYLDFRESDTAVSVNLARTTLQYVGGFDGGDIIANFEGVLGSRHNDLLKGGAAAEFLVGRDGRDTLDGGLGADTLEGGQDNDIYLVDNVADLVRELPGAFGGTDEVRASVSYTLSADATFGHVERLVLTGAAANGTGNALANTLIGNGLGNLLTGLAGNDQLYGKAGSDTLLGGDGNDRLIGGEGLDVLTGGAGNDRFEFAAATESAVGASRDRITDFATGDLIDLRLIDAAAATPEDDAFVVMTGTFTAPGQLRMTVTASGLLVQLNTDADATPEMELLLSGVAAALTGSAFLL